MIILGHPGLSMQKNMYSPKIIAIRYHLEFSNFSVAITLKNYDKIYSHHLFRLLKWLQYVANPDSAAFDGTVI